ncbi:hypothetical protein SAMN00017405_0686 [Desulfonispora thiosulfatigenes DSM 11270]|uniref:Uncharacterized protein n=1 Tax=Desulfonispora thiosulfatigenes DSM 11270 TaxID=656914 RepID=A0A1W1V9N0_DESTI|nr:hypothetical protein [Desulfonispora thiosulfatigenes]SMB89956.1 hypothetical protein SAMN00017405_0686 [Desulfonispora thiosulfatigenes DSM 11270]
MSGKIKIVHKMLISGIIAIVLVSQLAGCAVMDSKEMMSMIDAGQSITIELASPSYEVKIQGEQEKKIDWIKLDQLKTFNEGFRQGLDELFNINIVTENGVNGKSGCLYVDETGDRNGNTTLEDALRNKVFVTKYFKSEGIKTKLTKLAGEAYADIGDNELHGVLGTINAYYNLLPDAKNPSSFNATQSLSREEFYTLVYKTEEGVKEIRPDETFEDAVGGKITYSKFAQEVDEYSFLSVANKSLDKSSYTGSISRAEAI